MAKKPRKVLYSKHDQILNMKYQSLVGYDMKHKNIEYNKQRICLIPGTLDNLVGEIDIDAYLKYVLKLFEVKSSTNGYNKAVLQLNRAEQRFVDLYSNYFGVPIDNVEKYVVFPDKKQLITDRIK